MAEAPEPTFDEFEVEEGKDEDLRAEVGDDGEDDERDGEGADVEDDEVDLEDDDGSDELPERAEARAAGLVTPMMPSAAELLPGGKVKFTYDIVEAPDGSAISVRSADGSAGAALANAFDGMPFTTLVGQGLMEWEMVRDAAGRSSATLRFTAGCPPEEITRIKRCKNLLIVYPRVSTAKQAHGNGLVQQMQSVLQTAEATRPEPHSAQSAVTVEGIAKCSP